MRLLVTGGAGFIGSNFVQYILEKYPDYEVVNLDCPHLCRQPGQSQGGAGQPQAQVRPGQDRGRRPGGQADAGHRRGRQLRRRVPRRPEHRRAPGLHQDQRHGHAGAAGCRPAPQGEALLPDIHRRGLRRAPAGFKGEIHRGVPTASELSLLRQQDRRRPAGPGPITAPTICR